MNEVLSEPPPSGSRAAGRTYFSRHPKNLNLRRRVIAGLRRPLELRPFRNPERVDRRQRGAARKCLVAADINVSQYAAARRRASRDETGKRFFRIASVLFSLRGGAPSAGVRLQHGARVDQGDPTIKPGMQRAAPAAITHCAHRAADPAAALVSIDPRTGRSRRWRCHAAGTATVQFVRAPAGNRARHSDDRADDAVARGWTRSGRDLRAVHDQTESTCNRTIQLRVERRHVRARRFQALFYVPFLVRRECDGAVGQHRCYARLRSTAGPPRTSCDGAQVRHQHRRRCRRCRRRVGRSGDPLEMGVSVRDASPAGGVSPSRWRFTKVCCRTERLDTSANKKSWGKPQARERHPRLGSPRRHAGAAEAEHGLRHRGREAHVAEFTPDAGKSGHDGQLRGPGFKRVHRRTCRFAVMDRIPVGGVPSERARDRRFRPTFPEQIGTS